MGQVRRLDSILRRDQRVVVIALLVVTILAWAYLVLMPGMAMDRASMAGILAAPMSWSVGHAALMLLMWALMMLAMMLPSAAPMILLYGTVSRRRNSEHVDIGRHVLLFAFGYVLVWTGFAVSATAAQWGLEQTMLLSPAMATGSAVLASLIFMAAGAYQFTPLKQACLRHCRSPVEFLSRHWRRGAGGAVAMGMRHGAFCVGCCWVLMGLLFVGGVMNLAWIAALAAFVLMEKTLPAGPLLGRVLGVGLIIWGAAGLLAALM